MSNQMDIVLIEDNDDDAGSILKFLRQHVTNSVRLIQDGGEAAEYLLLNSDYVPKLILLDLVLPSLDGIELFKMIRSEPAARNIAVVFLISSCQTKAYIESMGLHPDGYLMKPRNGALPWRVE